MLVFFSLPTWGRVRFISIQSPLKNNPVSKTMKHPLNDKLWANRSQQAIHNPKMIHPEFNTRLTKTVDQFVPVAIHRVNQNTTYHQPNNQTEYVVYDKATQARTGRWVLNAIAAQENRKMSIVTNNSWYIDPKQVSNVR